MLLTRCSFDLLDFTIFNEGDGSMVECIGIRYKGVLYPPDKPPAGFFDGLAKSMKDMLDQRKLQNQSFMCLEDSNQGHAG